MSDNCTLRTALFETLTALKDGKMDLDRAKAINETAQTIINSAKVEVDFMKVSGRPVNNGFIPMLAAPEKEDVTSQSNTGHGVKLVEKVPGGTVTQHKMR